MTQLRLYAYNIELGRYFRITEDGVLNFEGKKGLNRIGGSNYKVVVEFDSYTDKKWLEEACKKKAALVYSSK